VVQLCCGIDSHKDTLAACLVDQTGRRLAAAGFPNTPAGHRQLATWLDRHGPVGRVGIEGGANLGAGLARFLADQGVDVREVPGALTVRERRRLRRPGKSDPTDALAIARICARDTDLPPARQAGLAEDLKVLSDYRDELLALRNAEGNRLHADLAIVCPGYGQVCRRLTAERSLAAAEQLLADQPSVRAQVARCRIMRLRELDGEIRQLAGQLATLVAASRTRLIDLVGIGPILAARILARSGRWPASRTLTTSPPPTAPPPSRSPPAGPTATVSIEAATAGSTVPCIMWPLPRPPGSLEQSPTWTASKPRARPSAKPCGASSGGCPTSSSRP
jgi:transposase